MKTLLKICVLLASLGAFASPTDPSIYQYWFDGNISSRTANTANYVASPDGISFDCSELSEGGHTLNFRMAYVSDDGKVMWGATTRYMFEIPSQKAVENRGANKYRLLLNGNVIETGDATDPNSFELNPVYPEEITLGWVDSRSFKYLTGEKKVSMTANGGISYGIQLSSDQGKWGAPLLKDITSQTVTTKQTPDSVQFPGVYYFEKVDNNNFKAFKFISKESSSLYLKPSQDCSVALFNIHDSYSDNLYNCGSWNLKKGETTQVSFGYSDKEVLAIFYNTKQSNPDGKIKVEMMLEDNKVPDVKYDFNYDTWKLALRCPDPRAKIYYTDNGDPVTAIGSLKEYKDTINIEKFTRIRAYAVYSDLGYADSNETDIQLGAAHLKIPTPTLKFVGGEGNNEFVFYNRVKGVKTIYRLDTGDMEDAVGRYEYNEGDAPIKINDGDYLQAYCVKDQLANSEYLAKSIYYSDYVTTTPSLSSTESRGEDYEYWSDRKHYMSLYVPEGKAYYRIVSGKQEGDVEVEGQWTPYDPNVNDGWIELPGNAFAGNQTVQVYAETDGKARSLVGNIYTDWVPAKKPKVEYNNYMLKLSTDVPGGNVYYCLGYWDDSSKILYDATNEELKDGLDVKDRYVVSFRVEAPGYQSSDVTNFYKDDHTLPNPWIAFEADGYLHVYSNIATDSEDVNAPQVTLNVECEPKSIYEQEGYEQVDGKQDHIRFIPDYNTTVRAWNSCWGKNNSVVSEMTPLAKPSFNISDYQVYIDVPYYDGDVEVYYTLDGSKPTKESTRYKFEWFDAPAGEVRAVVFMPNQIPSEGRDTVKNRTAEPEVAFNFDKVKLRCATPNAKIYYVFDNSIFESNRKLYDPNDPDYGQNGIEMADKRYIRAYAEADGYRRSEEVQVYMNEVNLDTPSISYNDGVLEIWHNNRYVTIVPTIVPAPAEENHTYDKETNKHTYKIGYNTTVSAHAEREGCYPSSEYEYQKLEHPIINTDEYNMVTIVNNGSYWSSQEIYYTTDGSLPTKDSEVYEGEFEGNADEVRAVLFVDGFVPVEALHKAKKPELVIDGNYAKLSSATPNAKIRYTTNLNVDYSNWKTYDTETNPNGIDISKTSYLYAYTEADNYANSDQVQFEKLEIPSISYVDGYVVASSYEDGVSMKFCDDSGNFFAVDSENPLRAKVPYNTEVKVFATKPGYLNSDCNSIEPCELPEIDVNKFWVTINAVSGTVKYTLDGSDPTPDSETYSNKFKVTSSCKIKAVAFPRTRYELPAMAEEDITYVKANAPTLTSYDGRYVTLAADNIDSDIKYVIDDSKDVANGDVASDKIELGGINTIRAIAQNDDEDDSDEFTFTPQYYADETNVYTSVPGVIKNAFGWCEDLSSIEKIAVHGSLLDSSNKDSGDYEYLRSLPGLRQLDLTNVTDTIVPDTALVSNKLLAVTMPKTIKKVGKTIFGESNTTLCAIELPENEYAPADLLNGVKNPNLLLYTKAKANVADLRTDDGAEVKNVVLIASGSGVNRADEVTLVNTHAFHAPKEFTAKKISFTRPFTKETQLEGNGAGWETMVVPFEVQSVKASDGRTLKPFGEANLNAGECPFWLFMASNGDWTKQASIDANIPYLLAFPNNPMYADEFSVNGDVTFSSANVDVPETPADDGESMSANFSASKYVNGNYNFIAKAEDIFALNDEDYTDGTHTYKPGGIFVANKRDVAPFECYVTAASEMKAVPLFDSSDVEGILGEYGTRIWSEGHNIYISSGIGMKIHIFDTVGQLIRIVNVKAGETACAENLTPGIYIVGNTKIYVK